MVYIFVMRESLFMKKVTNQPNYSKFKTVKGYKYCSDSNKQSIINTKLSIINNQPSINTTNKTLRIAVNNELLANIIQIRELRNKYITNQVLKTVSVYLIFKALTTSGVIQDYNKQMEMLAQQCNCSVSTLYNEINNLIGYGLCKRYDGSLILTSNENLYEYYEVTDRTYSVIEYDCSKHKLYMLLQARLLRLAQIKQEEQFERNISKVAEYKEYLKSITTHQDIRKGVHALQILAFKNGNPEADNINMFNADNQLRANSIRKLFKLKSHRSVAYLKKLIVKHGLGTVRERIVTTDQNPKQARACKSKKQHDKFNQDIGKCRWILPDEIELCAAINASSKN